MARPFLRHGRKHYETSSSRLRTTTHAIGAAIQRSQASLAQLSRELGINPQTVAKWWTRVTVEDLKTARRDPRITVLTAR
uniref:helix-turn-helix domain-containing protein n=1 Tax=Rhodophyticola porphyridii TaxID=1852017 RepID=UPI00389A272E